MFNICWAHWRWVCQICYPPQSTAAPGLVIASSGVASAAAMMSNNTGQGPRSQSTVAPTITTSASVKRPSTGTEPRQKRIKKTIIDDEVACKIFRSLSLNNTFLNSGKVLAWALQPDEPEFMLIHDYISRGQEHGYGIRVLNILRVIVRTDEIDDAPLEFKDDPDANGKLRMMLWHGTKRDALKSILENGLKLPRSHGQMFGPGIYFADRVSKSVNYCSDPDIYPGNVAYLFLCDVLLGHMFKAYTSLRNIRSPPTAPSASGIRAFLGMDSSTHHDSIKGCGENAPNPRGSVTIDGCVWPVGPTVKNREGGWFFSSYRLQYNEYIIYKPEQVQPKYLVKVKITRDPYFEKLA